MSLAHPAAFVRPIHVCGREEILCLGKLSEPGNGAADVKVVDLQQDREYDGGAQSAEDGQQSSGPDARG